MNLFGDAEGGEISEFRFSISFGILACPGYTPDRNAATWRMSRGRIAIARGTAGAWRFSPSTGGATMQRTVAAASPDGGSATEARGIDIVVADDHPVVLAGLSAVLGTDESGCRLVDQCRDAVTTFDAIRTHRPAVAVVKLEMDGALDLVRRVRRSRVPCGIILFASAIAEDQVLEAYRLGARGLLLKSLPVESIGECVRKVARGERWIEQNSAERVIERVAGGAAARKDGVLTSRERQIGKLAATGLRNREIADRLGISVGTVKVHLHNVYRKLGVRGRVQLATYARTRGFV